MLKAEKYKERIKELGYRFALCDGELKRCKDIKCNRCKFEVNERYRCADNKTKWLLEEYKEPILNEVEKKILQGVIEAIKPFTDVKPLILRGRRDTTGSKIVLCYGDEDICLPTFEDTMFENLELDKPYGLEELEL